MDFRSHQKGNSQSFVNILLSNPMLLRLTVMFSCRLLLMVPIINIFLSSSFLFVIYCFYLFTFCFCPASVFFFFKTESFRIWNMMICKNSIPQRNTPHCFVSIRSTKIDFHSLGDAPHGSCIVWTHQKLSLAIFFHMNRRCRFFVLFVENNFRIRVVNR